MAEQKTVRMTRAQDKAEAVANVPADQVKAWEAKGWKADKPKGKAETSNT